ncbi:MAG: hypothetical protein ABI567_02675, partial [Gammaproteobacteria bacterium]
MRILVKSLFPACALIVVALSASPAHAVQFTYLNPAYTQEIYAGPLLYGQESGMAWTVGNNLLTRAGSTINEYSLTQNTTHQGTALHGVIATHTIAGLDGSGFGMTNGADGYIYAITGIGLQRFDPGNWAAPAQTLASIGGPGYGITTLSDGRIAYAAGGGSDSIYVYDPVNLTNNLIYTANTLIDDMASSSGSEIALAGQGNSSLILISTAGSWINTVSNLIHYPDGLTFGDGYLSSSIFSNNNDGTITEYQFGSGFANAPTLLDIATGSGAYGDLAAVGPDCAFYVSQYENGSYHGATPGVGTNWDNAVTNGESSITRIAPAASGDGGAPTCGFRTPVITTVSSTLPVPG